MRRKVLTAALLVLLILICMPTAMAASGEKLIALTFDDGPGEHTERLLDGLAERNVVVTFFVQGVKVENHPDIIRRMVGEGHQVGNHSYNHPDLNALTIEESVFQLEQTDSILNEALGTHGSFYYRAPYGNSTELLRFSMNGPFFYWSLDSEDWVTKHEGMIRNKIITEAFDGAIILAHDTVPATIDATLDAIDHLQKQGYEFVTLKELFRRRGAYTEPGKQYYSYLPSYTLLPALEQPQVWVEGDQNFATVTMYSPSGVPIYYTVNGEPVMFDSMQYDGPFTVSLPCTIRAVAAVDLNGGRSQEWTATYIDASIFPPQNQEPSLKEEAVAEQDSPEMTRAELAQALYESVSTEYVVPENLFIDVSSQDAYAEGITWSYYAGLFSGTGDGNFEPDRIVTRQELAKVLCKLFGLKASDYWCLEDEHRVEEWAWGYVQAVVEFELMELEDGCFRPYDAVTWDEFYGILQRI